MSQSRFSQGSGPSQRQLRVGEVVRRRLSEVLLRGDVHDPDLNRHSITVGEVRLSPDLKIATAFVLPLGGRDAGEALADLRRNAAELRHLMGKGLGLKYTPALRFQLDETFDRLDDTRRMFSDERVRRDLDEDDGEGEGVDWADAGGADDDAPDDADARFGADDDPRPARAGDA